jgi:RNA polymerase sigma factor, sigma-70 family
VDEKQAIAQLKQGNLEGLETLVRLYQVQALRTVCLITGNQAQAEDIVQNAFIRAAEKIARFDANQAFGPWFIQSVIHDSLKMLNRQKRSISLDEAAENNSFDLFDPAPLPEEALAACEIRQAIWQALQKLPAKQRAATVMRYYLQMPEAEIAIALNGAPGTAKWWLFSARQRLSGLLRQMQTTEEISEVSTQSICQNNQEGRNER